MDILSTFNAMIIIIIFTVLNLNNLLLQFRQQQITKG